MIDTGLYLITDEHAMPHPQLLALVQDLTSHRLVSLVQYRAKTLPYDKQLAQTQALVEICHQNKALLLVNDNLRLALASHADGVHLGQQDTPITQAREALGPSAIIGVTCHNSLTKAQQAEAHSADYVAFGRFYPSNTKPTAPIAQVDTLRQAKHTLSIPIVAIGGITPDNGAPLLAAGADLLAVVGGILSAVNPRLTAHAYHSLFRMKDKH